MIETKHTKISKNKIQVLILVLAFLCVLFGATTTLWGQALEIAQTNPQNMTVCMGDYEYKLMLTNQSETEGAQNITLTIKFPDGITYKQGSIIHAGESNISDLNQPVFFIEQLQPGAALELSYFAAASCEIIPDVKNNQSVTNTVQLNYAIGENQMPMLVAAPLSYNLLFADVNLMVNNPLNAGQIMKGDVYSHLTSEHRTLTVQNEGTGSTDTVRIRISPEPEIHYTGFYSLDGQTEIPFVLDGNDYVLTVAGLALQTSMLDVVANDNVFQSGEKFRIVEDFSVVACAGYDSLGTVYVASWGCNNQNCNEADNNAQTSANISVSAFEPSLSLKTGTFPASDLANYCGDDAYLEFLYINEGLAPGGWAKNLDLFVSYGPQGVVSLSDFSINGAPVSDGLHGLRIHDTLVTDRCDPSTTFIPSIHFDFSQADSAIGNMNNLGDDVFFDDLAPGDTIVIRYKVHIEDSMEFFDLCADPSYRSLNMGLPKAHYESQCGENYCVPETNQPAYAASIYGGSNQTYAPSDMVENDPETFRFCTTGWDTRNEILKCDLDSFYLTVFLPEGYQLAGTGNPSWEASFSGETESLTAVQTGNIIRVNGGGHDPVFPGNYFYWNGCYQLDLELVCNPLLEDHTTISWEMDYACDDCSSIQNRACGSQQINNHFSCGSGLCPGIETTGFQLDRTSLGWTDFTQTQRVTANTPGINTKTAYPGDSIRANITGKVHSTGLTQVFAEISYEGQSAMLQALEGSFYIYDQSGVLQTSCSGAQAMPVQNGTSSFLRFELPCSYSFSAGDSIVFQGYLKVGTTGILNDQIIPALQAQFVAIKNNQEISCTVWGEAFTLYEPKTSFYEYFNNAGSCEVRTVKLMAKQDQAHSTEDFPNEFRNAYRLKDTVRVIVPSGFEIPSNSVTAYFYATTGGLNASLALDHTELVPAASVSGDTLVFVSNWPANDRVKQNVPVFGFDLVPTCQADNQAVLSIDYNWTYCDYASDSATKQTIYGKMESMSNPVFDGFSHMAMQYQQANLTTAIVSNITQDGFEREVNYTIELCNQPTTENPNPGQAKNVWMDVDQLIGNDGKLLVDQVQEIPNTNNLTVFHYGQNGDSSLFVQIGNLNAGQCRTFEVRVHYTNCQQNDQDSLRVLTGWSCAGYPNAADAEASLCQLNPDYLVLRYKTADLAWVLDLPQNTFEIGDTLPYEILLSSTAPAYLYELNLGLALPQHVELIGQQYLYPLNSGIWRDLPQASNWDLTTLIPELAALNHGIYGTQQADSNKVKIRFQLLSSCGIQADELFNFHASGITNCGDSINLKFENVLPLSGFEIIDSLAISIAVPDSLITSTDTVFAITITNLRDTDANPADRLEVVLPHGITYLSGFNNPEITSEADGIHVSGTVNPAPQANSSRTIQLYVHVGQTDTTALSVSASISLIHNSPIETSPCSTEYLLASCDALTHSINPVPPTVFCISLSGNSKFCSNESRCMTIDDSFNQINQIDWFRDGVYFGTGDSLCVSVGGAFSAQIHLTSGIVDACSALALTVIPAPSIDLPDTLYVCAAGQEFVLDAGNETFEHLWHRDGVLAGQEQTLTVSSAGMYSVNINPGQRCSARDSVLVLNRAADLHLLSTDYSICGNQVFTLSTGCDPFFTYTWERRADANAAWSTLPGSTNACSVQLSGSGALLSAATEFKVLIYDQLSGCSSEVFTTVSRLPYPCKRIVLYPNPTIDHHIQLNFDIQDQQYTEAHVEVYSLTGELIKLIVISPRSERIELDLTGIALGSYFARLVTDNEVLANERFIIAE